MFSIFLSIDVNECLTNRKLCSCADGSYGCGARCINTHGSFRCSCGEGYRLFRETTCVGKYVIQLNTESNETLGWKVVPLELLTTTWITSFSICIILHVLLNTCLFVFGVFWKAQRLTCIFFSVCHSSHRTLQSGAPSATNKGLLLNTWKLELGAEMWKNQLHKIVKNLFDKLRKSFMNATAI